MPKYVAVKMNAKGNNEIFFVSLKESECHCVDFENFIHVISNEKFLLKLQSIATR